MSSPSNEVSVTVVPTGPMPDAPTNLVATAIGSTVTFAWTAPAGTAASDYRVEAGSAPGLSDLANFATGSTTTSFMGTGVGAGTFFIRVRAVNAAGAGSASNEVRLVVTDARAPCVGAPGAPRGLTAVVSGSTVALAWAASEGAPTSYVIEAGSSTGSKDLANFDTARTSPSLRVTGVGNGAYFVRVRAKNACGASPPSNEVLVTVQ
jgi:predicted phage tail protein